MLGIPQAGTFHDTIPTECQASGKRGGYAITVGVILIKEKERHTAAPPIKQSSEPTKVNTDGWQTLRKTTG